MDKKPVQNVRKCPINPAKRFERFGKYIKNQEKGLIIYRVFIL
jgi:hypothetical protein